MIPSGVGGKKQVLIAQTFDQSAIAIAAFAELTGLLFNAAFKREREQLVIELDFDPLGYIAARVQYLAAVGFDPSHGDQQVAGSADGVANLAIDIRDFAALLQQIGIEQIAWQNEADAALLQNVGRRVAENKVSVGRNIRQAASFVGDEHHIRDDAHDVAMQRFSLLQTLGTCAMFAQMVDLIFQLGNLGPQALIFSDKVRVRFATLSHRSRRRQKS